MWLSRDLFFRYLHGDTIVEFGSYAHDGSWQFIFKVDHAYKTATVFHNAYELLVVYEDALRVIKELEAEGYTRTTERKIKCSPERHFRVCMSIAPQVLYQYEQTLIRCCE